MEHRPMRKYLILTVLCLSSLILVSDKYLTGACPSTGGGGSTSRGGSGTGIPAAQRPPLGVGIQPLIQSIQSLASVADPWEVWWSRNRDKYLTFREQIQWTDIIDQGGTKSYAVSPIYDALINTLADSVGDKDPYLAFRAAIALGKVQDSQNPAVSSPKAVEILKKAHEAETRSFVRNNVLFGLGLTSDNSIAGIIKDTLQNKNEKAAALRRSYAALALSYMTTDPEVPKILSDIISTEKEDREVKSSCCIALGNLKAASAVLILGKIMTGDGGKKEQAMIRSYAALGLGRIGTKEALEELKKIAPGTEKEEDVRVAAVTAMGMTGLPEAKDAILALLKDKAQQVKGMACVALAQIKYD